MASPFAYLLEEDPDLGAGLDDEERAVARAALVGILDRVPKGRWAGINDGEQLGAIVLEGLILREMTVAGRPSAELLGAGDVLLPLGEDEVTFVGRAVAWRVLAPARLAWLGRPVLAGFVRWPGVARTILQRSERRVARVMAMQSLAHLSPVEDRLLGVLWLLAERWGRVGADGVLLPLPVTHRTLGQLIGARRSSVTSGLGALQHAGRLERLPQEGWLLRGPCPTLLREPGGRNASEQDGAPPRGAIG